MSVASEKYVSSATLPQKMKTTYVLAQLKEVALLRWQPLRYQTHEGPTFTLPRMSRRKAKQLKILSMPNFNINTTRLFFSLSSRFVANILRFSRAFLLFLCSHWLSLTVSFSVFHCTHSEVSNSCDAYKQQINAINRVEKIYDFTVRLHGTWWAKLNTQTMTTTTATAASTAAAAIQRMATANGMVAMVHSADAVADAIPLLLG